MQFFPRETGYSIDRGFAGHTTVFMHLLYEKEKENERMRASTLLLITILNQSLQSPELGVMS